MKTNVFENALWIWNDISYDKNEYTEFVEKLIWNGEETKIRISVSGDYTLFVNGVYAASNQYGDFEHYKVYDELDITPFLKKGENRICFLVWYFGRSGMRWFTPSPGLLYEIVQGEEAVLYSSRETLSRKSIAYVNGSDRKISNQLGYSFIYDASEEDNWLYKEEKGFSESAVIEKETVLFKRPVKKLCVGNAATGVIRKTENSYIIDLGREIVGFPYVSFVSDSVQKVNVAYGEILEGGHVKRKLGARDFSFDYISQYGENEYTNYMLRFACRYLEITSEKPLDLKAAGILPHYYPVKEKEIPPIEETDRRIYEICLNTLKLCMLEHYVDCPWREQCLYAFDSRNQMLAGYDAFEDGNFDYARANLLLISKDNRKDGILSICFPSDDDFAIPSFSLWYVIAVKEYMQASGDLSLGRAVFSKLKSLLQAFCNNMEDGLVQRFTGENYWNFYDWSPYANFLHHKGKKPDLPINCLFILALNAFEDICKRLSEENIFAGVAEKIGEKLSRKYYDKERKLFFVSDTDTEPTELANSLAVLSGIAPEESLTHICDCLASGKLTQCSLSIKTLKYDALIKADKVRYKDAVLSEIRKTYTKMLDAGSDTVWETAEGAEDFEKAGSLCHGWSSIPIYYYHLLIINT